MYEEEEIIGNDSFKIDDDLEDTDPIDEIHSFGEYEEEDPDKDYN